MAMLKYLARTVRLLSGQLDQMAFRPARWRVARYLLSLAPEGAERSPCTQEDIAAGVSASRVTVSRIPQRLCPPGLGRAGLPRPHRAGTRPPCGRCAGE